MACLRAHWRGREGSKRWERITRLPTRLQGGKASIREECGQRSHPTAGQSPGDIEGWTGSTAKHPPSSWKDRTIMHQHQDAPAAPPFPAPPPTFLLYRSCVVSPPADDRKKPRLCSTLTPQEKRSCASGGGAWARMNQGRGGARAGSAFPHTSLQASPSSHLPHTSPQASPSSHLPHTSPQASPSSPHTYGTANPHTCPHTSPLSPRTS